MKKILYVVIGLFVVYLILCLVGPSQMKIERSMDINTSAEIIKPKLADLKFFYEKWSPWTEKDPNMKTIFTGEVGKEGSSMSWESDVEDVGKGVMTYKYTHGDTIVELLNFDGHGDANVYHIVNSDGAGSRVNWVMQNSVPFLFRGVMLFMNIDKMVAPDFEKGLAKLKKTMEEMPKETKELAYDVKELQWDVKTYYGIKTINIAFDKIGPFFGQSYGKIGEALSKAKVQPLMPPKALYFKYDENNKTCDVAAVIEVANGSKVSGIEKFEFPPSKVLHIAYYGAYDKSVNAHYAIDNYMKENKLIQSAVLEEYVTDPMMEKDTAKWLTNIYYFIKK